MDGGVDFIQRLEQDMCIKILGCLEDPSDLVRVCAVSSSWRQFVISNGLCKQLCLRMFPEILNFDYVVEITDMFQSTPTETKTDDSSERACLEKEHNAYASLSRHLTSSAEGNIILNAFDASSTNNYPKESIVNTLMSYDRDFYGVASYWSSEGQTDPTLSEALIYELDKGFCLTEVHVHPFEAYFQPDFPIYSSKAVRFLVGYSKSLLRPDDQEFSEDKFVWTYSSPEFPMTQENQSQKFKLPKPVSTFGGYLKVELLGRVQTKEMDGQYYICINHVQAVGIRLSPAFEIRQLDDHRKIRLIYRPFEIQQLDYHRKSRSVLYNLMFSPEYLESPGSSSRCPYNRSMDYAKYTVDSDSDYDYGYEYDCSDSDSDSDFIYSRKYYDY